MDSKSRHPKTSITTHLLQAAHGFDFFQAVRLLEWIYREHSQTHPDDQRFPVGHDHSPSREVVRFKAQPTLSFPASAIGDLRFDTLAGKKSSPPEMQIAFMGLTGPTGVLPEHYTQLLIQLIRAKDYALRDFLDLFNHRSVSLFFRAWEKYRLPVTYERARLNPTQPDRFTQCLRSLVGLGTPHLEQRLAENDDVLLFYAGHFAHRPANAVSLQCLLSEYLQVPVQIGEFAGHWLSIEADEQTRVPGRSCPSGQYHALGVNAVLGERSWDVRSKFRLRVGPLSYEKFTGLMPSGERLLRLCHLTRTYVGTELAFDIQPVLEAEQVPNCRLATFKATFTGEPDYQPRLGWNTWLCSEPVKQDADDAIFYFE